MKALSRGLIKAASFVTDAALMIAFSPLLIAIYIYLWARRARNYFELWAHYDGNRTAQALDRWKRL